MRTRCLFILVPFLAAAAASASAPQQQRSAPSRREVAVTFDDVPGVAMPRKERCNPAAMEAMNAKLLRTIAAHRVPAIGLVVENNLCGADDETLRRILNAWLDAGHDLGNHSFSHFDLNTTPLARYTADVIRGETITREVLARRGRTLKYFRHPFLHAGRDRATRQGLDAFLAGRGYTLAPVTIDNQEWVFAEVYARALQQGDRATAARIAGAYIAYMDDIFAFFEKRSVEVTGRDIRQVLLLHANPLNADHFGEVAAMMTRRGYTFISLERALEDPAYRLSDTYAGPAGLSWIHRWGLSKGMPLREEPREPAFIARLFETYFNQPAR